MAQAEKDEAKPRRQEEEEAAVAADGAEEVGAVLAPADLQVELPVLAALVLVRDLKGTNG